MISYLSELYQGVAKIILNILDSLNYQLLGTIVSSYYRRSHSLYIYFHQGSKVNINDVCLSIFLIFFNINTLVTNELNTSNSLEIL